MTPAQFKEMKEKITMDLKERHLRIKMLFEKEDNDIKKYKQVAGLHDFLEKHKITSNNIYWYEIDTILEEIKWFKQDVANLWFYILGNFCEDHEEDPDDSYYVYHKFCFEYYIPKDNIKSLIKIKTQVAFEKKVHDTYLKRENSRQSKYSRPVSCNIVTLFLEEKISFDTLIDLTYWDCKV